MIDVPEQQLLATIRQVWRSAFGQRRVAYLSGPITTGARFLDWWKVEGRLLPPDSPEYSERLRTAVVQPNEAALKSTADALRVQYHEPVIEPASVFIPGWNQRDYLDLWEQFITDHASRLLLMDGWEFSAGCAAEFARAHQEDLPTARTDGTPIVGRDGLDEIRAALARVEKLEHPPQYLLHSLRTTRDTLEAVLPTVVYVPGGGMPRKDVALDRLADLINVAQFVSFEPEHGRPRQAFSRVAGESPNEQFANVRNAAETLLARSADGSVNVRSFTPESPLSREFIYGLKVVDDVVAAINRLTQDGLNTILNETIDIHDGGVSGVLMGGVLEFASDDTPRAVEKPGIASLPIGWGLRLLATVYKFEPDLAVPHKSRLEFSLHPTRRGWRHTHTLGWEIAEYDGPKLQAAVQWPNRFSQMLGDKVFGLLVAHHLGLPVPRTTVIGRRVAPFCFGEPTGLSETWFRTAPSEQMPGAFTSTSGWSDPFRIMQEEDPQHSFIAAILAQDAVLPQYSGASIVLENGEIYTEGLAGAGDRFMLGTAAPHELPARVLADVEALHKAAASELGSIRLEWVHDGVRAWVVQMHRGATQSTLDVLVPGDASEWVTVDAAQGLENLRSTIESLQPGYGIRLIGHVGLTSHMADVIRKARIPAKMDSQVDL